MENTNSKLRWVYLIGFFLILALPLLNLPPWFSPPDWGKTIVFRIILSILIFLFIYEILSNGKFSIKTSLPFWLLIFLFSVYLLATIFSLDRNFSLWGSPFRSGGFLNFAFYIFFAILAFLILKNEDWQKIWDFAILIGILVSIVAIFQQFGLISKILIPSEVRPPSTIGGPIFLAIYLLLLSFLTLSFGIKESSKKRFFYFFSFLLFLFVILITGSRAAYIGLAMGILYFLFFYPKKMIWLKLTAGVFLILGIFGVYYLNTHITEIFSIPLISKNFTLGSLLERFTIRLFVIDPRFSAWRIALKALKERPILGWGPENFSIGFDKYYDPTLPYMTGIVWGGIGWYDRAHNFLFDIGVTAGIPALMIYLAVFGILFYELQRLKNKNQSKALIAHGIQATFLVYLVANFFSFDTFSSYLISFLLISFSLSLISKDIPERTFYFNVRGKFLIIFLLFIVLIWFIYFYNIKPFQINKEIKIALYQMENKHYEQALATMEKILPSHSFLDQYLRLEYIDIIGSCIKEMPERKLALSQKATQILKENVKIRPYYTRNWLLLGIHTNVLIANGQEELKNEANYYFERAYQLSPKRQEIFVEWIKTDLLTGEYSKAKEKAQKCIDLNPELGDCWWLKGLAQISLAENEKAQENIEIAGQKGYPIYSENSFLQLAKVYTETKNYQKLTEIYKELVKIEPSNPKYYIALAVVYKEMGDFENAKKEALKILELFPEIKEEVEIFLKTLE